MLAQRHRFSSKLGTGGVYCFKLSDRVDAVLVASIVRTELCICDLATLSGLPESEIHDRLESLVEKRIISHRLINGMNYFHLAIGFEAGKLREHILKIDHPS